VAVKLNSADFQKGGYDIGDAKQVVEWLNGEDIDFVEISGGSYESAAMMGMATDGRAQSTIEREMYFIDFAKDIAASAQMPLMVTGGVTKRVPLPVVKSKNQIFKALSTMAMTKMNLYRMGDGLPPKSKLSPLFSTVKQQLKNKGQTSRYKKWLESRDA